ncbi:MAG: GDSL family lipase, partial [Fibrobacter sp.]|nr:GDSL family lipase [Fibrobacter sp.]
DMIAFDIKGVYRTGCKPAKVVNDTQDTSLAIAKPVREMKVQPAATKTFNALGRKMPASAESRRNQPAGRYYSR